MNHLQETSVPCPYCGEHIVILLDPSVEEQQYIEDCQVCCRPMEVFVTAVPDGDCHVEVRGENE